MSTRWIRIYVVFQFYVWKFNQLIICDACETLKCFQYSLFRDRSSRSTLDVGSTRIRWSGGFLSITNRIKPASAHTLLEKPEILDYVNVTADLHGCVTHDDFFTNRNATEIPFYVQEQTGLLQSSTDITPVNDDNTALKDFCCNGDSTSVNINGLDKKYSQQSRYYNTTQTLTPKLNSILWWKWLNPLRLIFGSQHKNSTDISSIRAMWRHRHARCAEEGIRHETTHRPTMLLSNRHSTRRLSSVLNKASGSIERTSRHYVARTITGLLNALAEEVQDLDVEVESRRDTPWHNKHVDAIRIKFARLGFKPLRMGGHDVTAIPQRRYDKMSTKQSRGTRDSYNDVDGLFLSADEAFDKIDADNSGFLDREELIQAFNLAARLSNSTLYEDIDNGSNLVILEGLASDLFELYDINGDGVVDRKEYKNMVEDMAALRRVETLSMRKAEQSIHDFEKQESWVDRFFSVMYGRLGSILNVKKQDEFLATDEPNKTSSTKSTVFQEVESMYLDRSGLMKSASITFSDLKIDIRQIFWGGIPFIKHITPGGPLILEPFTTRVIGSFNREDMMNSVLLDIGLRRLVMRVVRKQVGGLRDFVEGAVFRGRSWKTFGGEGGPKVEISEITNIEFDQSNKLIITGRARVQSSPESPVIKQAFKVRTSIGTSSEGRHIRLEDPEIALVIECPTSWEIAFHRVCDALSIRKPPRPEPIYSFFPIQSPFKMQVDPGFYLGEDNKIESLYILNGALRFELSAILRPGRFLGSHYIAFTVPQRTFIVTLDRVAEGMRSARKVKKAARALKHASDRRSSLSLDRAEDALLARQEEKQAQQDTAARSRKPKIKGFFSRFVDGYLQAERDDAKKERLTTAIRDFFGRQEG